MTKQEISNYFIEILNTLEIKVSPKYPNSVFYLYKDNVYIWYDQENNKARLSNDKIWSVFKTKYSDNDEKIIELTSDLIKNHLNLKRASAAQGDKLIFNEAKKHPKLKEKTININDHFDWKKMEKQFKSKIVSVAMKKIIKFIFTN